MSTRLKEGHFLLPVNVKKWDDLAPVPKHADNYAAINLNEQPPRMINGISYSNEYILANSMETLNDHISKGYDRALAADREIADMVAEHRCSSAFIMYRGITKAELKKMRKMAGWSKGVSLYDEGYSIGSTVRGYQQETKYQLRIYVPAGTSAVYLGKLNADIRYAVALHSGVKLKVVCIDRFFINCVVVE